MMISTGQAHRRALYGTLEGSFAANRGICLTGLALHVRGAQPLVGGSPENAFPFTFARSQPQDAPTDRRIRHRAEAERSQHSGVDLLLDDENADRALLAVAEAMVHKGKLAGDVAQELETHAATGWDVPRLHATHR